jgi:putative tryptophan/tyrosine transport system substrate-binding protein
VAWPIGARAQQPQRIPRLGYLASTESEHGVYDAGAFRQALADLGWEEGRNIHVDYRFGAADLTAASVLAKELIDLQPDVVVARGTPAATALRQYTLSIPIVFFYVPDPVAVGFVTNLARPNGNMTGFTGFEFSVGGKWLQLLKDYSPSITRVAVLFDPGNPSWTAYLRAIEAAAPQIGVQLIPAAVRNGEQIEQAISGLAANPNGAVLALPAKAILANRKRLFSLVARHRLPAIYSDRTYTADGGLMSYGVDVVHLSKRAASYADRILKGSKPAELPIEQPDKYYFVINLKTAKALGLTIPPTLLAGANEVIE